MACLLLEQFDSAPAGADGVDVDRQLVPPLLPDAKCELAREDVDIVIARVDNSTITFMTGS